MSKECLSIPQFIRHQKSAHHQPTLKIPPSKVKGGHNTLKYGEAVWRRQLRLSSCSDLPRKSMAQIMTALTHSTGSAAARKSPLWRSTQATPKTGDQLLLEHRTARNWGRGIREKKKSWHGKILHAGFDDTSPSNNWNNILKFQQILNLVYACGKRATCVQGVAPGDKAKCVHG